MSQGVRLRSAAMLMVATSVLSLTILQEIQSSPTATVGKTALKEFGSKNVNNSSLKVKLANPSTAKKEASKQVDSSQRFQPRMMNIESQQQVKGQENYFADSWHPHNLEPTFSDQEQGDEMVALASGSESGHHSIALPPQQQQVDSQKDLVPDMPSVSSALSTDKSRDFGKQDGKLGQPVGDEYYGEEDDEEEEPAGKQIKGDFDNNRKERNKMRTRGESSDMANYGDYSSSSGSQYDDNYSLKSVRLPETSSGPVVNRSVKISEPMNDSGWQPAGLQATTESRHQPSSSSPMNPTSQQSKQYTISDRLAEVFGNRESIGSPFSRTDAAIEYLRGLLRSKQSMQENSTLTGDISKSVKLPTVDKSSSSNHQRLSAFHSRLNQILNVTTPSQDQGQSFANTLTNETTKLDPQATSDIKKMPEADSATLVRSAPAQTNADAKFSISDAKTNRDLAYQTQSNIALATTKLPAIGTTQEVGRSPIVPSPNYVTKSKPENPTFSSQQEFLPLSGIPNGTPLGGDYIEGMDDYPRGTNQQQQQQQMVSMESQVSKQTVEQPPIPVDLSNPQPKRQYLSQQQIQSDAMQYHSSMYDTYSQGTRELPTSSRFFQIQQQIPEQPQPKSSQRPTAVISGPVKAAIKENVQAQQVAAGHPETEPSVANLAPQLAYNKTTDQGLRKERAEDQIKQLVSNSRMRPQAYHEYSQSQNIRQQPQPQPQQQQQQQQQPLISSKLYRNEDQKPQQYQPIGPQTIEPQIKSHQGRPVEQPMQPVPQAPQVANSNIKPPKIVSYNYFESPAEGEGEMTATNFQLGDALYSSNGGFEHLLSNSELEAIQNQFMTAEHPVVPLGAEQGGYSQQASTYTDQDANIAGILSNLKPSDQQPSILQNLHSPAKQAEEAMKELGSEEEPVSVAAPNVVKHLSGLNERERHQIEAEIRKHSSVDNKGADLGKKKKSLIVYLNHPRPIDMSKTGSDSDPSQFIAAKEFDSQGLSKDNKQLEIASLPDLKDGQDKDGLSVVVVGDAYKYKKIVLLISSKSGGLKFIPMVKDMRR